MTILDQWGGWPAILTDLLEGRDLPAEQARGAMATILAGEATAAQLIGFVVALRAKGESAVFISPSRNPNPRSCATCGPPALI